MCVATAQNGTEQYPMTTFSRSKTGGRTARWRTNQLTNSSANVLFWKTEVSLGNSKKKHVRTTINEKHYLFGSYHIHPGLLRAGSGSTGASCIRFQSFVTPPQGADGSE
jgi:hypothetical protein